MVERKQKPTNSSKAKPRKVSEKAGKIPDPQTPALIPQPHGGALLSGGVPGHKGGTGRPPSEIRKIAREAWADRIPLLTEIADAKSQESSDRLRALDQLAKYGLGTTKELTVEHIRERLSEQIQRIYAAFPRDVADEIIGVIEPVWRTK